MPPNLLAVVHSASKLPVISSGMFVVNVGSCVVIYNWNETPVGGSYNTAP